MSRWLRAAGWVAAAALLAAATDRPEELRGPLSDFWARVKRDWSRRLPGLNHGRSQTAIWVAMIWDGPDEHAVQEIASTLQEREARRWVRSQVTRHRWSEISRRDLGRMQALRHNIILLGTPQDNDLVARALERTPLRVSRGEITIGKRRLGGDGLLLFAVTPNPVDPRHYALVITGSSVSALKDAAEVPYGETDYVLFRGRKVLERGYFTWSGGAPSREAVARAQSFTEHFNWAAQPSAHCRLHYDPSSISAARAARLGLRMDAELEETASFYGIRVEEIAPIDWYLYASVDEKVNQTADARPAHVDPADGSIHAVHSWQEGGPSALDPSLGARVLLRRASRKWGENAERELPGLAVALSLACRETFQTIGLQQWAARSPRDAGYVPMDILLSRRPGDPDSGDLAALDAAAFIRDLMQRESAERLALLYRTARRSDFRERFHEIFGLSIAAAEARWLAGLQRRDVATPAGSREGAGSREEAGGLSIQARAEFRAGRFERAAATAARALEAPGGSAEARAWARLTLGRAHAMAGRLAAAFAELKGAEVREGPEQVQVIADYWLETLGQPLNRRAASRVLMQQADADLMNYEWDEAERKLRAVLASDPQNREAHATLGKVYLSKYQYWHDWMLLDRELFPGDSQADPETYRFLADKGREELRMAESLPFGEQDRWMSEAGPVDPGADQPMAHLLLGKVHLIRGELELARREVETALALRPANRTLLAYCHLYLGRIAAAMGDAREARAQFETVVRLAASEQVTAFGKEELARLTAASPRP